jgi:hypothetical protein
MTDLFIKRGATYSADKTLRLTLTREWGDGKSACFLGHNPSTAGHELEDPTTLTWTRFAKLWGCGRYTAVNLYPLRSPDPDVARQWAAWDKTRDWTVRDLLMENEGIVVREAKRADIFVACYGAIALDDAWNEHILEAIQSGEPPYPDIYIFGLTSAGAPKHPMARGKHRVPRDQQPILWRRGEPTSAASSTSDASK